MPVTKLFAILFLSFLIPTVLGGWWKPTPGVSWQWQLANPDAIDTTLGVEMFGKTKHHALATIDLLHGKGKIVVCYMSAGSYESQRPDAGDFPASVLGNEISGWAGERFLDIRQIDLLSPIMTNRLDLAVQKKCDGIEGDWMENYYENSGFPLTMADSIAYAKWFAAQGHARNLSMGLKNSEEMQAALVNDFDWTLNEQCYENNVCDMLKPFYDAGKAVFGTEYNVLPSSFCPKAYAAGYSWLYKHLNLDAYVQACPIRPYNGTTSTSPSGTTNPSATTSPTAPPLSEAQKSSSKANVGVIVGVTIAVVVVLALIAAGVAYFLVKRRAAVKSTVRTEEMEKRFLY